MTTAPRPQPSTSDEIEAYAAELAAIAPGLSEEQVDELHQAIRLGASAPQQKVDGLALTKRLKPRIIQYQGDAS